NCRAPPFKANTSLPHEQSRRGGARVAAFRKNLSYRRGVRKQSRRRFACDRRTRSLLSFYVNPALELLALPSSRPRIVRIGWKARARLAADACVAQFVQLEQRDVVILRVPPDVTRRPPGQWRDLAD